MCIILYYINLMRPKNKNKNNKLTKLFANLHIPDVVQNTNFV